MSAARTPTPWIAAALAALPLAACMRIIESAPATTAGTTAVCESQLGSYFLPRRDIVVRVTRPEAASRERRIEISVSPARADRGHHYCLDHLALGTTTDRVAVERSGGLLTRIQTRAEDRQAATGREITTIVGTGLTSHPAVTPSGLLTGGAPRGDATVLHETQFDPFDPAATAQVNRALGALGFCVVVHGVTAPVQTSPAETCGDAIDVRPRPTLRTALASPLRNGEARGILYRPNLTYEVAVLHREATDPRSGWRIAHASQVELPNVAPIFSIEVPRTLFADRRASISFSDGVLANVQIDRPNEIVAVAELALSVTRTMIGIPAQIIQIRTNTIDNQQRIIFAQAALIRSIRDFEAATAAANEQTVEAQRAAEAQRDRNAPGSPVRARGPRRAVSGARGAPAPAPPPACPSGDPACIEAFDRCIDDDRTEEDCIDRLAREHP